MLDPKPILDEIWEAYILENFKSSSLAKSDGRTDSYEHVAYIKIPIIVIEDP